MKKALSVMILLAFFGSTIIMTGCLGGSDGITPGLAIFTIAVLVSGGSAAAPAFAANTYSPLRPALSEATDKTKVKIEIIPLKDGVEQTANKITVDSNAIDWVDTNSDDNYELKASYQLSQVDGFNEYRVKVIYDDTATLLEGVEHLKDAEKAGTVNVAVNETSTAKALVYDNWKTTAPTATYEAFEFNFNTDNPDIRAIEINITNELTSNTTNPDYSASGADTITVDTKPVVYYYSISGFVTAGDGVSGSSGTLVWLRRASDNEMVHHVMTDEGNYTFRDIAEGSYNVVPEKADHVFTPASRTVNLNGADVSSVNFQAAPAR